MGADKMSSVALKLYQGLTDAGEDKEKAKIFADAFEELEQHYPEVKDLATGAHLTEKSLLLQKEIKEIESNLQRDMREIESNLKLEMSSLQKEMQENKIEMLKSISQQTWRYFTGLSILAVVLTISTALIVQYIK